MQNRRAAANVPGGVALYVLRRVLWAGATFVAVTLSTFIIFFVIPSDVSSAFRGRQATLEIRHELSFQGPFLVEYGDFLRRLFWHGSLGQSYTTQGSVNKVVENAAPVTASLVLGGAVVWLLLAFPIGLLSALRPRSLLDRAGIVFVLIGVSAHPVWIGLVLSYVFGFRLHVFPPSGYCDIVNPSTGCGGMWQWAYHLVLPWFTFALLFAARYVRMIRDSTLEALTEDYVRTARAKGASEWRILRSHVLRNALLPVVTMTGMDIGYALGGTIFVEKVFGLPGLGKVVEQSLDRLDLPQIMAVVVFVTTAIVFLNLLVDLLYAWLDPRIRLSAPPEEKERRRAPQVEAEPALGLEPAAGG